MKIRTITPSDTDAWLAMRCELWPDSSTAVHRDEIKQFFDGQFPIDSYEVLVADAGNGNLAGFVELSLRPYAEGCSSHHVAYLEGWYVRPEVRQTGVGKALVVAAEKWGRKRGATEFASDTKPGNTMSIAAHRALGFEDVGLVRCFRKIL